MKLLPFILSAAVISFPIFATPSKNADGFAAQLDAAQKKEQNAREQIADEQSRIKSVKHQIENIDNKIADIQREKFNLLGITVKDISLAETQLSILKKELENLSNIVPEDLLKRKSEIDSLDKRLCELKARPAVRLAELTGKVYRFELAFLRVKTEFDSICDRRNAAGETKTDNDSVVAAAVSPWVDKYTVKAVYGRSETLLRIAGYPEIYGDSHKWYLIYDANKDLINRNYQKLKNSGNTNYTQPQDVIFPGQVLIIPR